MHKPSRTGLARLYYAAVYSLKGFKAAWANEEAFRMEICLAIVFVPASFYVGEGLSHQLILFLSCVLVLVAEIVNTAIESLVDRHGSEHNLLAGQAKDLGSLVVFITMMAFLVVWGLSVWKFLY